MNRSAHMGKKEPISLVFRDILLIVYRAHNCMRLTNYEMNVTLLHMLITLDNY